MSLYLYTRCGKSPSQFGSYQQFMASPLRIDSISKILSQKRNWNCGHAHMHAHARTRLGGRDERVRIF